jgi:hypothetical protein
MKNVLFAVIALATPVLANAAPRTITCTFVELHAVIPQPAGLINFDTVKAKLVNCDGEASARLLVGENNSACVAANNLRAFFEGAVAGEQVQLTVDDFRTGNTDGSFRESTDVLYAVRQSGAKMVPAILTDKHGRPKACTSTQVALRR